MKKMSKLVIPDEIKEERPYYGHSERHALWHLESQGFSPFAKVLKLVTFNNLDSSLTLLNVDVKNRSSVYVKWLCKKHNRIETSKIEWFIQEVDANTCSHDRIEKEIVKNNIFFASRKEMKGLTFPFIFEELCAIDSYVFAGSTLQITVQCEKHGLLKINPKLYPYYVNCWHCAEEDEKARQRNNKKRFDYVSISNVLSLEDMQKIFESSGIKGKVLEVDEASHYSYDEAYNCVVLVNTILKSFLVVRDGNEIVLLNGIKFKLDKYNRCTIEFAQMCLDNIKKDAYYVERVYKDNTTKQIEVEATCSICEATRCFKLRDWEHHINCTHGNDAIHGKTSKYELFVFNYLTFRKIKFEEQFIIRTSRTLRCDFYLNDFNIIIEYNGRQHYFYTEYFHRTAEGFADQQDRDRLKAKFCMENGIRLIIIDGRTCNTEEAIIKYLNEQLF